jgi:predicted CXXCH cytochrome family protein
MRTMKKKSRIFLTYAYILALALVLSGATAGTIASAEGESSKDACLKCHGPFDKLTAKTANYKFPSGETTSPHRYVTHDSKDIPECTNCHKPHPVPLTSNEGLPKANGEWCYSCHHIKNLQTCSTCHK